MTDAAATTQGDGAVVKKKKTVRRKPLWLMVPIEFKEVPVLDEEGFETGEKMKKPASYALVRCESKNEVQKALGAAGIDITADEILAHVLLLRADPIPLHVDRQVTVKF
jgi:hypothetical protein